VKLSNWTGVSFKMMGVGLDVPSSKSSRILVSSINRKQVYWMYNLFGKSFNGGTGLDKGIKRKH